jgi:insulysin
MSIENYRDVGIATFKYISMLRSTGLSPPHQKEISVLSNIDFRFSEKRPPGDYAVWVADKLAWPVPRDLVIKAPEVVSEWDPDGIAQAVATRTLEGLNVRNSRTVLMAKDGVFQKLLGTQQWQKEPWYGTQYRVERLDDAFIREVRRTHSFEFGPSDLMLSQAEGPNTIDAFHLPRPNEFIPERLDVDKLEVTQVCLNQFVSPRHCLKRKLSVSAPGASPSDIPKPTYESLAQEGRSVLGAQGSSYHRNAHTSCKRVSPQLRLDQVRS